MINKKMKKQSTTVGFRLPNELVEDIDFLREAQSIDRGTFIKNALSCFVGLALDEYKGEVIKDYIHLITDEKELKEALEEDQDYEIPKDIQEARAQLLKIQMQDKNKKVRI